MTTTWKIIGRGQNGWHANGVSDWGTSSSSGGELTKYAAEAPDGTPVYDACDADSDAFVRWVISGPMADHTLAPGTVDRFGAEDRRTLAGMMPGLGGGFETLGAMALIEGDKPFGSFDRLALDLWMSLFRERVPGVRWGRVQNGQVIWES